MTPEEIRNQCEDDADRAPCDLTVWRDRGVIIAAQQTRIAQLEAQVARVEALADDWHGDLSRPRSMHRFTAAIRLRAALREPS